MSKANTKRVDEYQSYEFYTKNAKSTQNGFSAFEVEGVPYFAYFKEGKLSLISQSYKSVKGRDNGIESTKRNMKAEKNYRYKTFGNGGNYYGIVAGNGQEVAVSVPYTSEAQARNSAGRTMGKRSAASTNTQRTSAAPAKAPPSRVSSAKSKPASKGRTGDYRPLSFYQDYSSSEEGFNSFSADGGHFFTYNRNKKIVLISESYTSRAGRDNGIKSVMKNMPVEARYAMRTHENGKSYFDLKAGNSQEIATSVWYSTGAAAGKGAAALRSGSSQTAKTSTKVSKAKTSGAKASAASSKAKVSSKAKKTSNEDNYRPLAFYKRQTNGKKKGIERFTGDDGLHYFTYNENGQIALISEGYPAASTRDTGAASVEKNIKIEKRFKTAKLKNGKHQLRLHAGNHKEIARSVWYGSAAAGVTAMGYMIGKRRPEVSSTGKPASKASPKAIVKPKAPVKSKSVSKKAPVAGAAALGATGLAATSAKPKSKAAPKAAVKATPKTAIKKAPIAGAAALGAAGLAAATAKPNSKAPVERASKTVMAPAIAAPVAPAAAPATAAVKGGFGWLKWLLPLLLLLVMFFAFKNCSAPKVALPGVDTAAIADQAKAKAEAAAATAAAAKAKAEQVAAAAKLKADAAAAKLAESAKLAGIAKETVMRPAERVEISAPVSTSSTGLNICGTSEVEIFNVPTYSTPRKLQRLGTHPEFGDSHALSPSQFRDKLSNKAAISNYDRGYVNYVARSLGYANFASIPASAFSNEVLPVGTNGLLGFGEAHAYAYSTLPTNEHDRQAFRIEGLNGKIVHFMKTCGNYMYACQ